MTRAFDEYFMALAIEEAEKSAAAGEVPAGCVIVEPAVAEPAHDGRPPVFDPDPLKARVLAAAGNATESAADATAHAEISAIRAASRLKGAWRLSGARLYATKEPCPMCGGGVILARLDAAVWGVSDPKRGAHTVFGMFSHPGVNHRPETVPGVLEERCSELMARFFAARRVR